MRSVGVVSKLFRYPVKSMAAEALETCAVSWHGFAGDRRWAFVRPGSERSGFPWFTIREQSGLWQYQPRFEDAGNVEGSRTLVRTPGGAEFDVADPALAAELGEGVRVMKQYSGVFDTFPISLLSLQSVAALSGLAGQTLDALRFRPNLVIDTTDAEPFPEDRWVGRILRIGAFRCRLDARDKRCVMVTVDPAGGAANPQVLRAIANERNARFGIYGTAVEPGEVRAGSEVFLEDPQ